MLVSGVLDLPSEQVPDELFPVGERLEIEAGGDFQPAVFGSTFADAPEGGVLVYRDSAGYLGIAVNRGRVAESLRLRPVAALGVVEASAWGEGAAVVVDRVPELLGEDQDDSGFAPHPDHPVLVAAHRRHRGVRVPRTRAVFEALAAAAIEQVVTGLEAHRAGRDLLLRFGDPAPGAPAGTPGGPAAGMRVPPSARGWAGIPSWEWLRAGVEERRRRVVLHAARCAPALERTTALPL